MLLRLIGALSKLFLDLLVKRDIALQDLDLLCHLIVRLNQVLRVFRLIVELGRQLMVLQDGQSRLSLELLIVERHQVSLSLLDFKVHLLSQLLDVLDLLELCLVDANHAFAFLSLVLHLKRGDLHLHVLLFISQRFLLLHDVFFVLNVRLKHFQLLLVLFPDVGHCIVLLSFCRRVGGSLLVSRILQHLDGHQLLGVRFSVPRLRFVHAAMVDVYGLLSFFQLASRTLILFLINTHFIKELLEDLTLSHIERLVLIRVHP